MLKRLLRRLTGNTANASATTTSRPPAAPPANAGSEPITAYDAHGREIRIDRADWLEKALKPQLQAKWNEPDALYPLILNALEDGFIADIEAASAQLLAIDPIIERGHVLRSIVLMKLDRHDDAERVLRAAIAKIGETGILLTNLAKIQDAKGDTARADATLWRGLTLDPNQDNGLGWWVAREHERGGEPAYVAALEKAAALPGSWRATLWLGRQRLKAGDVDAAIAKFHEVLAQGTYDRDTLLTISGDLGNAGYIVQAVELVAPHYDPALHTPQTGLNLLHAYLHLARLEEGEALLDRLYALNMPPLKHHLDALSRQYQDRRREATPSRPVEESSLQIAQVPFELPIWMYGLRDPDWLLTRKPADARRVLFLMLGKVMQGTRQAEEQREDEAGRLSRAIPLYLAESAYEWTGWRAHSLVSAVIGGGPIVFGAQDETSERDTALRLAELADLVVQGSIDEAEGRWTVTLNIRDTSTGDAIAQESLTADQDGLETGVLELETRLLGHLGGAQAQPHDRLYARPRSDEMQPYLNALAQSLTLGLVANQIIPKDAMWGERNMLEWPLQMALQWPHLEVAKLMYLSGISHAARYQSNLLREFEERSFALLSDMRTQSSPVAGLAPLLWHAYGRADGIAAVRQNARDMRLLAWLDRVTA